MTQITLLEERAPIYSESGYVISILDEGGGELVRVTSNLDTGQGVSFNPNEWASLRVAIDAMVERIDEEKEPRK